MQERYRKDAAEVANSLGKSRKESQAYNVKTKLALHTFCSKQVLRLGSNNVHAEVWMNKQNKSKLPIIRLPQRTTVQHSVMQQNEF